MNSYDNNDNIVSQSYSHVETPICIDFMGANDSLGNCTDTLTPPSVKGPLYFEKHFSTKFSYRKSNSVFSYSPGCVLVDPCRAHRQLLDFSCCQHRHTKSDKSSLTSQHFKYELKHSLVLAHVSSRCCSRVDSIINSHK